MKYYTHNNISDFFNDRYTKSEEIIAEKKLYAIDMLESVLTTNQARLKVLDIGCGTGRITKILKDKGFDVIGADISSIAIEQLNEKGIDGFVHDVKDKLPIKNNTFDIIFTTDLLELVPDIFLFLSEVRRVAKNGSLFVFTMPNLSWLPYRIKALLGKSSSDLMPSSHCRFWSMHAVNYFLNNEYYKVISKGG